MTIHAEFEKLIPPLSKEEFNQLEKNILADGIRDALITWNGFLIDGHNRYEIAQRYDLTFQTVEKEFNSEDDVKEWIILNQFGRRNLPAYERAKLALKLADLFHKRAKENQGTRTDIRQNSDKSIIPIDTKIELAKIAGLSHDTIHKVSTIEELATPVQKFRLQSGEESINKIYNEIRFANKQELIEKRKDEYLAAHQANITEENRPIIYKSDCVEFLNGIDNYSIDLLLTDPPYSTDIGNVLEFATNWLPKALDKIKTTGRAFICIGAYPEEIHAYLSVLFKQDRFFVDNPLIWTYRNTLGVTPKMKYNLNYQIVLHLYTEQSIELDTSVTNEMFSVQEINAPDGRLGDRFHMWQKPDELAMRLIKHATKEGNIVLDCFACTGTFLLAAAKLGRHTIGCDISAENLEIANQRGCVIV